MADAPELPTVSETIAEIARGAISAEENAHACLARLDAIEDKVRAFVHLDREHVLAQARALDKQRAQGKTLGPLHGIPVGVKDIFDTADYPTENGSKLFQGRRPFRDATVVAKLRLAGAIILKTVTTECAFYHPGPTRNPHNPQHTPGGSSSGSAAAVAAGMVPVALGSQTNGSVIRPAAFCGVVGVKPSHGLTSRAGVLPLSRTLDHVGVFARNLADAALILDVITGYDPDDPDTRPFAAPDFSRILAEPWPIAPRFGFVRTPVWDRADPETRKAFEDLVARLGEHITTLDLHESFVGAWDMHRKIMAVEMTHNLGSVVANGGDLASKRLRDFLAEGARVSGVDYLEACSAAKRHAVGLDEIFQHCNAILTPAAKGVAPKGLDSTGDPVFCTLWTLTGLPAVSLPLLRGEDEMPLGVQLVGARGDDARLLRTAAWLQHRLSPKRRTGRRAR